MRREIEQARETLRAIRAGGFDALVIDTGSGDELFTLGSDEGPYRLVEVIAAGAPTYFRAVALDYDGTLAEGEIAPDTLAALAEARARGIRVILVTGRIISELWGVFAGFEDRLDAVVAENGAVMVTPGRGSPAGRPDRSRGEPDAQRPWRGPPQRDVAGRLRGGRRAGRAGGDPRVGVWTASSCAAGGS